MREFYNADCVLECKERLIDFIIENNGCFEETEVLIKITLSDFIKKK